MSIERISTHVDDLLDVAQLLHVQTRGIISPVIPEENEQTYEQNCWGFTAQAAGWVYYRDWLDQDTMEDFLDAYTEETDNPQAGDIIVYRTDTYECIDELMHTAILIDPQTGALLHKPGNNPIEFEPTETQRSYNVYRVSYRHVITGEE